MWREAGQRGDLASADLQFIESEILISAILQFAEEYEMPARPIHDSIIVPKRGEIIGRRCLSGAFTRKAKMAPVIEIKE
ncbi:hypothetical protein [Paracoccus zhejiangensis]|uniref:Uncharacterized protein n=1 Tax=Paracoccus zhejiangensis TaxID=1077935 RepID=A0A2H5EW37_9RHOB|nr:hypothetical protein [Paracoccus zhejiangensis]AUH63493.1 hypothetical protein CX676_04340 [Paracoccus zhejiangensis]